MDRRSRIEQTIRDLIDAHLFEEPCGEGDPLLGQELDSLDIEELVAAIEDTFGIRFEDEELDPARFAALPGLVDVVLAKGALPDGHDGTVVR